MTSSSVTVSRPASPAVETRVSSREGGAREAVQRLRRIQRPILREDIQEPVLNYSSSIHRGLGRSLTAGHPHERKVLEELAAEGAGAHLRAEWRVGG